MIHLDTSVLVDSLTGACRSQPTLRQIIEKGERVGISTLVLYEWLRGPRTETQLALQEALLPAAQAVPFAPEEAALAARLFRTLSRPRTRSIDIAVAACALRYEASLWTLNPQDFRDVPELVLYTPTRADLGPRSTPR